MSSTVLELMRLNHELSERAELALGEELDIKPNGQKAKVWQQHRLKGIAEQILTCNKELSDQYADHDHLLREELTRIHEGSLAAFDKALHNTLEYYEKFPGLQSTETRLPTVPIAVEFSGEEVFGKYLDLNPLFLAFANMMNAKKVNMEIDYLQYLERFSSFFFIPEDVRGSPAYLTYLNDLWSYLHSFHTRTNPLINLEPTIAEWEAEFRQKVVSGEIKVKSRAATAKEPQPLRLGMYHQVSDLEALGMDRLKEALEALGLKCGGTLADRAERLWAVRGKKPEDIPANLKAKRQAKAAAGESSDNSERIARLEFQITSLCEVMGDIVSASRRHAEKQQARSVEEKQQEIFEEEHGLIVEHDVHQAEEEDEAPIYNPLNLPLGWDGKPIPYWLYKLHGLGVEYKCEVCGNQSYWGRKAFDRHFQEWKHSHGMRCLGVPNTKHFHDITKIEEVLALYAKIKDQLRREQYLGDLDEEFEDTQGNVLNKRTYEDLARQGLL